jgi:hypothetical protein
VSAKMTSGAHNMRISQTRPRKDSVPFHLVSIMTLATRRPQVFLWKMPTG